MTASCHPRPPRRSPASRCRWSTRCAPSERSAGCTSTPSTRTCCCALLELSLKAPTSSNTQDWTYMVVEDPEQKARMARLYRRLYRTFSPIERQTNRDDRRAAQHAPGQWQAEHFDELPVFVIPCYRADIKHRPVGRPQISVSSFYGSVYPAVQNLLLSCRAVGLGASLQTLPIWWMPVDPQDPRAPEDHGARCASSRSAGPGSLRPDHPAARSARWCTSTTTATGPSSTPTSPPSLAPRNPEPSSGPQSDGRSPPANVCTLGSYVPALAAPSTT